MNKWGINNGNYFKAGPVTISWNKLVCVYFPSLLLISRIFEFESETTTDSQPSNQPSENCRYKVSDWLSLKFGTKWIWRISENPSSRAGATKCFLSRQRAVTSKSDSIYMNERYHYENALKQNAFKPHCIKRAYVKLKSLTCSCGKSCHWPWRAWRLTEPSPGTWDDKNNDNV